MNPVNPLSLLVLLTTVLMGGEMVGGDLWKSVEEANVELRRSCSRLKDLDDNRPNNPPPPIKLTVLCSTDTWGRKGGVQELNLDTPHCWHHSTIVHELMHVIGLIHEHQRNDRDNYVKVHYPLPVGRNHDYAKMSDLGYDDQTPIGPYDFQSIMHYSRYFKGTLMISAIAEPIQENNAAIGNREFPTKYDVLKISTLYKCDVCPKWLDWGEWMDVGVCQWRRRQCASKGFSKVSTIETSGCNFEDIIMATQLRNDSESDDTSRFLSGNSTGEENMKTLEVESDMNNQTRSNASSCLDPDEFLCDNSSTLCIPRRALRDGKKDCPHGDDEDDGPSCPRHTFKCPGEGSECVARDAVCDGVADCGDGADERGCPSWNPTSDVVATPDSQMPPFLLRQAKRQVLRYLLQYGNPSAVSNNLRHYFQRNYGGKWCVIIYPQARQFSHATIWSKGGTYANLEVGGLSVQIYETYDLVSPPRHYTWDTVSVVNDTNMSALKLAATKDQFRKAVLVMGGKHSDLIRTHMKNYFDLIFGPSWQIVVYPTKDTYLYTSFSSKNGEYCHLKFGDFGLQVFKPNILPALSFNPATHFLLTRNWMSAENGAEVLELVRRIVTANTNDTVAICRKVQGEMNDRFGSGSKTWSVFLVPLNTKISAYWYFAHNDKNIRILLSDATELVIFSG